MMFEGEFESLKRLKETNTVSVPSPIKVILKQPEKSETQRIKNMDYSSYLSDTQPSNTSEENKTKTYKIIIPRCGLKQANQKRGE